MTASKPGSSQAAVTVAAAQFAAIADVTANLGTIEKLLASAAGQGAKLAVFPEAAMYDFTASASDLAMIARRDGRRFEAAIHAMSKRYSMTVVVGMYSEGSGELSRNTFIVAGPDGHNVGRYEKLHLYDAFHYKESDKNERAPLLENFAELCLFNFGGLRFGMLNCYDLRFPEMARALVDRGADVLLIGSGWVAGPLKEMHWDTLLRARAIENTCYVAAACQSAPLSVGLSMVVDPSGLSIATVADNEGLAIAHLTAARLSGVRRILPSLEHRRYDVVQRKDVSAQPLSSIETTRTSSHLSFTKEVQ